MMRPLFRSLIGANERGITQDDIISSIQAAILAAYHKEFPETAEEVLAADFFAKRYGGEGPSYLEKVRALLEEFRHFDEESGHQ